MNITIHKSILVLCLLFLTILQVSAQTFDPAKYYQIANKVSNKVLEVKDASTAEGAQIFQWVAVTGKANQLWQVKKRAGGTYNFVSKSSGKLIDADNCTEGAIIKQYAADGTNSQNWKLIAQTDGSFKILNQSCNKYIRLESGSSADGASVGIKNDFGTDAFKWLIRETTSSQGSISGMLFEDKNNNGKYDGADAPLAGVKLSLSLVGSQNVDFTTTETLTDSKGAYIFTNLPAALYSVNAPFNVGNLILPDFSTTTGRIIIDLAAGQNYKNADYAYVKTNSISGFVYNDKNKNGQYDIGELPIENALIQIFNSAGVALPNSGTTTDKNGNYIFLLPQNADTYTIKFLPYNYGKPNEQITSPPTVKVVVGNKQQVTGINAGYALPSLYGNFSIQFRENNTLNPSVILKDANGVVVGQSKTSNLAYFFLNLKAGTYTLTFPATYGGFNITTINPQTVKIVDGQSVQVDANYGKSVLYFQALYDRNNNGSRDCNKGIVCDEFLANVPVSLCNSAGVVIKTAVTALSARGDNGFEFDGIEANTKYIIKVPNVLSNGLKLISGTTDIPFTSTTNPNYYVLARYNDVLPTPSLSQSKVLDLNAHAEPNRVQLQWVNNTGSQNDYFTLEKLNQTTELFEKIEIINSKTTQTNEFYTAYDNAVTEGDNTYRVALTMLDGTVKTSEIKTVNFKNLNDIRIFPNPADEFINVDLRKYEGKTVALSVYNSVGLLVKKQTIEKVSAAPQQIDVQGFGTGSYLLRVQSEGKREVTRLFHIAK